MFSPKNIPAFQHLQHRIISPKNSLNKSPKNSFQIPSSFQKMNQIQKYNLKTLIENKNNELRKSSNPDITQSLQKNLIIRKSHIITKNYQSNEKNLNKNEKKQTKKPSLHNLLRNIRFENQSNQNYQSQECQTRFFEDKFLDEIEIFSSRQYLPSSKNQKLRNSQVLLKQQCSIEQKQEIQQQQQQQNYPSNFEQIKQLSELKSEKQQQKFIFKLDLQNLKSKIKDRKRKSLELNTVNTFQKYEQLCC